VKEKIYDESHRAVVINQVLKALNYLDSLNLVHRDLKPDNIMYSAPSGNLDFDKLQIKIIDFGFAKFSEGKDLNEFLGTPYFLAPEIVKKEKYGTKCDVWSMGVLTYLLLTGSMPFDAKNKDDLFKQIEEGDFNKDTKWDIISEEGKKFVSDCLIVDQDLRPSPATLLTYPWIIQLKLKKLESRKLVQFEVQKQLSVSIKDNLTVLMKATQFQKTMITYMNSLNFNNKEIDDLRHKFEEVDENNDGSLSV
jgi:calcium-dependent protein kinase